MEIMNKSVEEIRKMDVKGLRELESDVRRELTLMRMDVNAPGGHKGKARGLKATLARVMTIKTEAKLAGKKA